MNGSQVLAGAAVGSSLTGIERFTSELTPVAVSRRLPFFVMWTCPQGS